MNNAVDILAISPHPDDAELFCGGLLASATAAGQKTAIVDLTKGELSTNGSPESRAKEAASASEVLGLSNRINLGLPDGGIHANAGFDSDQLAVLVDALRELKPKLLLLPFKEDRHPDHRAASELSRQAVFFAGLKKYSGKKYLAPYAVPASIYYQMRFSFRPSFVVDVSESYQKKSAAIACYQSQVERTKETGETLINAPLSLKAIEARDMYYGAMIGKQYGEPYYSESMLAVKNPLELVGQELPLLFPGE